MGTSPRCMEDFLRTVTFSVPVGGGEREEGGTSPEGRVRVKAADVSRVCSLPGSRFTRVSSPNPPGHPMRKRGHGEGGI